MVRLNIQRCNRKWNKTFHGFIITFVLAESNNFSWSCFYLLNGVHSDASEPQRKNEQRCYMLHESVCTNVLKCSLSFGHEKFIFWPDFSCYTQLTISLRENSLLYASHVMWVFHKFHSNVFWCDVFRLYLCIINTEITIHKPL